MIFNKKGQAAMEFLMTYGWALLVVLIAIAALAFFGLLNPSRFLPEKCEVAPGLTCLDFTASTTDGTVDLTSNVTILLNNGIGQTMRDVSIDVTECATVCDTYNTVANRCNGAAALVINEGDSVLINVSSCADMVGNTRFKSDITLNYNTKVESYELAHSKQGYLVVQVEQI